MTLAAHVPDERLIDLASGLVAEAETPALLSHLEVCPECESRFRRTCREAELARLRAPAGRPRRRAPLWSAAAAAAVLLVAALAFVWNRSAAPDPAGYWFPLGTDTVGLRTGEVDADRAAFEAATDAYRRRDARRVVELLEGKAIPEAHDPLKIALASAYVKVGQATKARELLEAMEIASIPRPDRDRAQWILLSALQAEGKAEEARAIAADLASRPGEFSEAAARLSR